jgi:hypothetical protein
MDRRDRAAQEIRLVVAMHRAEQRRRDGDEMVRFRNRAQEIFDNLEGTIADDPELIDLLAQARRELRLGPPSDRLGVSEQAIDGGGQLVDGERLR